MKKPARFVRRTAVLRYTKLPADFPQAPGFAEGFFAGMAVGKAVAKLPYGYRAQSVTVLGRWKGNGRGPQTKLERAVENVCADCGLARLNPRSGVHGGACAGCLHSSGKHSWERAPQTRPEGT